jgi:hypothetical protein
MAKQRYWTDYPFQGLGDEPGKEAPIRACNLLAYDTDKYVGVTVNGKRFSIKRWYVYIQEGRCQQVPVVDDATLDQLPRLDDSFISA